MAQVPYDHLLSIGFLNARPDGRKHAETFDAVVIGNDGSLRPVADLMNEIVSGGAPGAGAHCDQPAALAHAPLAPRDLTATTGRCYAGISIMRSFSLSKKISALGGAQA